MSVPPMDILTWPELHRELDYYAEFHWLLIHGKPYGS